MNRKVLYEVDDVSIKDSVVFVDFWNEERLIKGYLDQVDDGALDVICLVEGIDINVVLENDFCSLLCRYILESEW